MSAAVASLFIPIDVGHGQVPWQYNTLCDWTTTTLLSIACGQTLAVCVARPQSRKWWLAFGALSLLHLTDLLYAILLQVTWAAGSIFLPHLMGTSSGILGLLFFCMSTAFIIYNYVLASAVRSSLPIWERLLRTFVGLTLGFVSLLLCIRIAPDYARLRGGADTVLYFGSRAIIPYCFWSCIQHPARSFSSCFARETQAD